MKGCPLETLCEMLGGAARASEALRAPSAQWRRIGFHPWAQQHGLKCLRPSAADWTVYVQRSGQQGTAAREQPLSQSWVVLQLRHFCREGQ